MPRSPSRPPPPRSAREVSRVSPPPRRASDADSPIPSNGAGDDRDGEGGHAADGGAPASESMEIGPGGVPPGGPSSGSGAPSPLITMLNSIRPGSPESQTAMMFLRYMHDHGILPAEGQHVKIVFPLFF